MFDLEEEYRAETARQAALATELNFTLAPTDDQEDEVAGTVLAHLSKRGALGDVGAVLPAKKTKAEPLADGNGVGSGNADADVNGDAVTAGEDTAADVLPQTQPFSVRQEWAGRGGGDWS